MKKMDKILIEYEKAQDSAEHHNNSMWTLIYMGLGLSILILYVFWTIDTRVDSVKIDLPKYMMLSFGSIILGYFSKIIEDTHKNKKIKYKICKEIEKKHHFIGQHFKTKNQKNFNINFLRIIIIGIFIFYIVSVGLYSFILNNLNQFSILHIIPGIFIYTISIIFIVFEVTYFWNNAEKAEK